MTTFKNVTPKHDCVTTYATDDGLTKIIKRPSDPAWVLMSFSLFNMLGTELGRYPTLEAAIAAAN